MTKKVVIRRNIGCGAAATAKALRRKGIGAALATPDIPPPRKKMPVLPTDLAEHVEQINYLNWYLSENEPFDDITDWEQDFVDSVAARVEGHTALTELQLRVLRSIIVKVTGGRTHWNEFLMAMSRVPTSPSTLVINFDE